MTVASNDQGDAPVEAVDKSQLEEEIVTALRTVYDPEIPVNIYEMGLIYNIDVGDEGHVGVTMTLTSPACPVAGTLPGEVEARVRDVPGVSSAEVEVVWDPVWNPSMMSEAARLELGML
jgi:FeS assembly SUF system protein